MFLRMQCLTFPFMDDKLAIAKFLKLHRTKVERLKMKVVYIGNCIHIFDDNERKFVKTSTKNLRAALGPAFAQQSRREMIASIVLNPQKFARS